MYLQFLGHDYRYAVEQSLLAFFPEERPSYNDSNENYAKVSLFEGKKYFTATSLIHYNGKEGRGISRVSKGNSLDTYSVEGLKQRIVKLSFFKAYQKLSGITPSWGALTGVRPAKLAAKYLEKGFSENKVDTLLKNIYCVSPSRRSLCIQSAQEGIRAKKNLSPNEISLYIGIPFCPTRCAYCSFVSQSVERSFYLMDPYVEMLCKEINLAGEMVKNTGLQIKTFYMGGGTPTTLSADQMNRVLTQLESSFDFQALQESCVEAGRPDTISRDKLQVLMDHGIQRISINPQTLENHVLRAIGRRHTAEEILSSMNLAKKMGFQHINMDLIAGLSQDTLDGFIRSLDGCISMGADNITVHTLALKKGSRLSTEGGSIPSPDVVEKMLDYSLEKLPQSQFHPYYLYRQKYMSGNFENVGWCKTGAECLYNIYIMEELHSILSLGAGGSTKMVNPYTGKIERLYHAKYPEEYMQQDLLIIQNLKKFSAFHSSFV